jgi:penicillin-binding protein 2
MNEIWRDDDDQSRYKRVLFILVFIGILLLSRLFYLQIVKGAQYEVESKENRIRVLRIMPQRGNIYDVNGKVLVTSRTAYTISLIDMGEEKVEEAAQGLAELLPITAEEIVEKVNNRYRRSEAVQIAIDVDFSLVTRVLERQERLPGVYIDYLPIREYPNGTALSHVLGYLSEISQEDLETWAENKGYYMGDIVGRAGLERSYEEVLRGESGGLVLEVDSSDNLIRVLERIEPVPGQDIYLTIDIDLQIMAEDLLKKSLSTVRSQPHATYQAKEAYSGAVVMLENKTGRILAMASYPDYDPNAWEMGVLADEDKRLQYLIGSKEYPNAMLNRAVLAALPPGSIFKPITLAAALENNVVNPYETVRCLGYYDVLSKDNPPKCWVYPSSHGPVNAIAALGQSCNSYFYEMGRRLGIDELDKFAKAFGLGEDTGFTDLLYQSEADYNFTHRSNPDYKNWAYENMLVLEDHWYDGETIFSAIGQQFSAFTPLQMASAMAQIANQGKRYAPALVDFIEDQEREKIQVFKPKLLSDLKLQDDTWKFIEQGLVAVTQRGGTSDRVYFGLNNELYLWQGLPYQVAAKTGTAQISDDPLDLRSHAWFSAYAPVDDPEITLTMVVEHGRSGSSACGPSISQLIRAYFADQPLQLNFID